MKKKIRYNACRSSSISGLILASDKNKCPIYQQCHLRDLEPTNNGEVALSVQENWSEIDGGLPSLLPPLSDKITEQVQKHQVLLHWYLRSFFLHLFKLDAFIIQIKI